MDKDKIILELQEQLSEASELIVQLASLLDNEYVIDDCRQFLAKIKKDE